MEVLEAYLKQGDLGDLLQVDKNKWQLMTPFVFHVSTDMGLRVHTVPKGFVCDMASIPKPLLPLFGEKPQIAWESVVLHDYFYVSTKVTRKYADDVFLAVMRYHQNPKQAWRRNLMYAAVRAFGWTGFRR